MASYNNGCGTATTTRSVLLTDQRGGSIVIQNNGAVAVYLGGATVTADTTATGGVSIAAGATLIVPSNGDQGRDLYVVTPSSTAQVGFLFC